MTATMAATMARTGTLWKQKRTMVTAVGGLLVLVVAGFAVLNLYTPGGQTQSAQSSITSSMEPVAGSLPIGTPAVPVDASAPRAGILSIESEPVGASVLINGAKLGLTPLELSELEMGSYTVRLEKAGYESEELIAELNTESPRASLNVPMRGQARRAPSLATLRVVSTPPGRTGFAGRQADGNDAARQASGSARRANDSLADDGLRAVGDDRPAPGGSD